MSVPRFVVADISSCGSVVSRLSMVSFCDEEDELHLNRFKDFSGNCTTSGPSCPRRRLSDPESLQESGHRSRSHRSFVVPRTVRESFLEELPEPEEELLEPEDGRSTKLDDETVRVMCIPKSSSNVTPSKFRPSVPRMPIRYESFDGDLNSLENILET